jgi:hypothetical protein
VYKFKAISTAIATMKTILVKRGRLIIIIQRLIVGFASNTHWNFYTLVAVSFSGIKVHKDELFFNFDATIVWVEQQQLCCQFWSVCLGLFFWFSV